MTQRDPNIMTVAEAARVSGVDSDTIYEWLRKGAVTEYRNPGGTKHVDVRECLPRPVTAIKTGTLPNITE